MEIAAIMAFKKDHFASLGSQAGYSECRRWTWDARGRHKEEARPALERIGGPPAPPLSVSTLDYGAWLVGTFAHMGVVRVRPCLWSTNKKLAKYERNRGELTQSGRTSATGRVQWRAKC